MVASVHFSINRAQLDRDTRALQRKLAKLSKKGVPRAQMRALNATAKRTRTHTVRELAREKALPQKPVRDRVKHFKASLRVLVASVWVGTKKHIPIESLPGAQFVLSGKHRGKLKAGRISVKPFRATMPSGHSGLFVRKLPGQRRTDGRPRSSPPNLPIEHPVIRLQPEAAEIIERQAGKQWREYFPRELRRLFLRELQR